MRTGNIEVARSMMTYLAFALVAHPRAWRRCIAIARDASRCSAKHHPHFNRMVDAIEFQLHFAEEEGRTRRLSHQGLVRAANLLLRKRSKALRLAGDSIRHAERERRAALDAKGGG